MKIRGLLFDLDGVLVSTERNHFYAWRDTAASLGIPFTEEDNEHLKGVSRVDSLKKILALGKVELNAQRFDELLKWKNEAYLNSISELSEKDLLPGVHNLLLEAGDNGLLLGVGSSSKNALYILEKLNIKSFFQVVIDGNMVTHPKPDPEVFLNGAMALQLSPSECYVFEDAASGIEAAKKGGFKAVGVGNPSIKEMADIYFNNLTEFKIKEHVEFV